MQVTVQMPAVSECAVNECAYNVNQACHARAITIGNGAQAGCDTYFGSAGHAKNIQQQAGVGACKVSGCSFNDDFECAAPEIHVGSEGIEAHCLTYQPR